MQRRRIWKQWLMMAGILLWLGILGPEIYVEQGTGCLANEEGRALTKEETEQLLEKWFYSDDKDMESQYEITYRSMLVEWLGAR